MSAQREMTLQEWVDKLPGIHSAHKEFDSLQATIAQQAERIAEMEAEAAENCRIIGIGAFLARIDAERGKEAVAFRLTDGDDVEYNGIDQFSCGRTGGEPLFLSPTILEGMAKDAERYRFIRMNRLWLKANLPLIAAPAFDEAIDAGLLAAAQGERK